MTLRKRLSEVALVAGLAGACDMEAADRKYTEHCQQTMDEKIRAATTPQQKADILFEAVEQAIASKIEPMHVGPCPGPHYSHHVEALSIVYPQQPAEVREAFGGRLDNYPHSNEWRDHDKREQVAIQQLFADINARLGRNALSK